MGFFPRDTYSFETAASPHEVAGRLASVVDARPASPFDPPLPHALFRGVVRPDGFELTPILRNRRNSWRPRLFGTIHVTPDGRTIVRVDMKMETFVVVFMCMWLGMAMFMASIVAFAAAHQREPQQLLIAMFPMCFAGVGYTIMRLAFRAEVPRVRADLDRVLHAAPAAAYR